MIDTHAGAGVYDLRGDLAQRSREAEAGVIRLLADPTAPSSLDLLKAAVAALNGARASNLYPGSPWLIAKALRSTDGYLGCELRPDDHVGLRRVVADLSVPGGPKLASLEGDGFAVATDRTVTRTLLLIDPPYERGDDYARIVETLAAAAGRSKSPVAALVWAPIKDLETFDALLRALEQLPFTEGWAAEARLRPLRDPMKLNGSAVIGLGLPTPHGVEAISAWAAASAGEAGAIGRVTPLFV